jgi:hypothetical protein
MTKDDHDRIQALLAKYVLVGLTYLDHNEQVLEQVQLHGHIVGIDDDVITVKLFSSGEEVTLPPDLSVFKEASPGDYTLRSTGEVVSDPDFVAQWTIHRPPPEGV